MKIGTYWNYESPTVAIGVKRTNARIANLQRKIDKDIKLMMGRLGSGRNR